MDSLNIPRSYQNLSFFVCKAQYPSFQNSDFDDISLHRNGHSRSKIILTIFFRVIFTIAVADVITYYIVCLSFPGPQAKFSGVSQVY